MSSVDPYEFVEEEYVPNPGTVDFSNSFIEDLFGSGYENEFDGFTREEVYFGEGSRVRNFHERGEKDSNKEDQQDQASKARGKKRKRDPSQ